MKHRAQSTVEKTKRKNGAKHNINHVMALYSIVTGIEDSAKILNMLSKTETFQHLQKGDWILLYEGYISNFLEIVEELKRMEDCPKEILDITSSTIVMINRARMKKYSYRRNYKFPN